jgi:serine/threonine protein kinase/Tol biopolymer transport system component
MTVTVGGRLGSYEIVAPLGVGGMGEVYRARDSRLGREIAIKVLPSAVALDPERRERFEREAKTIAALDHPHIVTIYSLEDADGVSFITMQLVRGRTLADVIPRGGMSVRQMLDIAVPLADALAAAHDRGVIHRDLKPANVMLGDDGRIKVLDFGLAKLREAPGSRVRSQLATEHVTREGQIVGTVAYMSPEQAAGKAVDHRSDIFSLGTMLYELATGEQPFTGDTPLSVMTAVLRDSPPKVTTRNSRLPRYFDRIVRRCLEKDPQRRYQSAGDVRNDLEDLAEDLGSGQVEARPGPETRTSRRTIRRIVAASAVVTLTTGAFFAGWLVRSRIEGAPDRSAELRQIQVTANPSSLPVTGAAVSPDGRYLAYTDPEGLYLRLVDSGETHAVPLPDGYRFWDLSWFPDGTRLLAAGHSASDEVMSLYSVAVLGGMPRKIREDAWRGAVSPDGRQIAFVPATFPVNEVWLMGANGEQPRRIVSGMGRETFWQVGWSPDSRRVLWGVLRVGGGPGAAIEAVALADGARTVVLKHSPRLFQNFRGVLPFTWLPEDRLVFAQRELPPNQFSSNLWEIQIDLATAATAGDPRRLTELAGLNIRDVRATVDGSRLSFLRERGQADVFVAPFERNGTTLGMPRRVTLDERHDIATDWTHDATAVLFQSHRGGTWDIFRQSLVGGPAEPLVVTSENETSPHFSPDGAWILFSRGATFAGGSRFMKMPAAGGPPELVVEAAVGGNIDCSLPPVHRCVLGETLKDVLVLTEFDPITGRGLELARFALHVPGLLNWALSPDGSQAAVVDFSNHVHILNFDGRPSRDLLVSGWTAFEFVDWSTDGEWVLLQGFAARGPRLVSDAILRLDLGGRVTVLRHEQNEWHIFQVPSPDGRYLASAGMLFESNAWLLDEVQ